MKRLVLPIVGLALMSLVLSGCTNSAKTTAEEFAIALNSENWYDVYTYLVPEYSNYLSEEDFYTAMQDTNTGITYVFEDVIVQGDTANAYFTINSGLFSRKMPLTMEKTEKGWRFDAFGGIKSSSCRLNGGTCEVDSDYVEPCEEGYFESDSRSCDSSIVEFVCCMPSRF